MIMKENEFRPPITATGSINISPQSKIDKCNETYEDFIDYINFHKDKENSNQIEDAVIIIACFDDLNGRIICNAIDPDHDYQQIRNRGETPYITAVASKKESKEILSLLDSGIEDKLETLTDVPVVIIDYSAIAIFCKNEEFPVVVADHKIAQIQVFDCDDNIQP